MAITDTHLFGWNKEMELLPVMTDLFGELPAKTAERYDEIDFITSLYNIELKARREWKSFAHETWMVPKCKFKQRDQEFCILYYWQGDNSLWYYIFDEEHVRLFEEVLNKNGQPTYLVPANLFTRVI